MGIFCCNKRSELADMDTEPGTGGQNISVVHSKLGIETTVIQCEKKMTISRVNPRTFLERLNSMPQMISSQELSELLSEKNIAKDQVFQLLESNGTYEVRKLKVLAILLGDAKLKEKFEWLFKEFDSHNKKILDESELRELLENVYHISVNISPRIALRTCNEIIEDELENYIDRFRCKKEILIEKICDRILKNGRIHYNELMKMLAKPKNQYSLISCTNGFRELLKKTTVTNPEV